MGLFTAWDPASALRGAGRAGWVAVQLDDEGGNSVSPTQLRAAGFKVFGWEARPSQAGVEKAAGLDGYIGQAENETEALACLAVNPAGPKAIVGNPGAWTPDTFQKLAAGGWELILEWYRNEQPWIIAPDGSNYPHLSNVLFGCYAVGDKRVSLAEYRSVWKGSYSVYLAETMSEDDWEAL